MKTTRPSSPLVLAAIAAASAAVPTSVFAQDASAPVEAVPAPVAESAPPAPVVQTAPAPVIVLPQTTAPVADAAPAAAPSAETTTSSTASTKTTAPRPATVLARPAPVTDTAVVAPEAKSDVVASDPAILPPVAASNANVIPAQPVDTARAAPTDDGSNALLFGGLAGLALIGIGGAAVLTRRRRPVAVVSPNERVEPVSARPAATSAQMADPVIAGNTAPTLASETPVRSTVTYDRTVPAAQVDDDYAVEKSTGLPVGPLPTGEERSKLFRSMVMAAPTAENPYHSRKRRRLQALRLMRAHEEGIRSRATEGFDYRTYRPTRGQVAEPALV